MFDFKMLVSEHKGLVSRLRQDLHRIPEVAYTEAKTSRYVADYLRELGLQVETEIARRGVVGLMKGVSSGKTLMIRADMDALMVKEETGLDFASTHEGVMHACGHDGHMSMVLVAATILSQIKEHLRGNIKFLFQPAEEGPGGAKPMIEEGVMENPTVDYAIGCHVWPGTPEGTIGVGGGPLMAAMDRFDLKIIGKGGHGAMPHLCVDALEVGTQVINALQRIVSRQMDPINPAVVTVGSFHSGKAFNVISGEAEMSGTTRTFDRDVWKRFPEKMERVIRGVCESMGASHELDYVFGYPPLINDAEVAALVHRCAEEVVGKERVIVPEPTMGGEDMAYFLEKAKGCYFFLGVGREGCASLHNPKFDFNEKTLSLGVETYCRVAWELLGRG
ncbi:MAG: amidohydrolase [Deltaproteobacteria bacterium]|nr:amidohydrolase [Deltaproteobacteria bacterium]HDZ24667.1 amidohydrolase [Desulfobacteraceae bacterium]